MAVNFEHGFAKPLSPTDVKKDFVVPVNGLNHLEFDGQVPQSIWLHARDVKDNPFPLLLKVRSNRQGHLKPEIRAGTWSKFVKSKNLKAGDMVFFWRDPNVFNNESLVFTIGVRRALKIFGKIVGYSEQIE